VEEPLLCSFPASQDQGSSLKSCLVQAPGPVPLAAHEVLDRKWGTCFVLKAALGPDECLNLIEAARTLGYGKAVPAYPPSYRNNGRLVVDDEPLAEELFKRILRQLPDPMVDENGAHWRPVGLNRRFRFCCYQPGEYFTIHRDGVFHSSANRCSRLTFMVYLNSNREFEGGSTRFFTSSDVTAVPLARVTPQTGALIVFDHSLWHDGEIVTRGTKFIMRSDILYEKESSNEDSNAELPDRHAGYIWSVVELADGSVASGGRDKTIRLWDRCGATLTCREVLRGHANSITALSAVGGDELWSGSRDRSIRIWRRRRGTFSCATNIDAHEGTVLCLAKLYDGRVASGGADGTIRLWSRDGECERKLSGDSTWVWDIKPLDRETLVSGV
jgi:predicted 2-oxoglutarate/Fe(II)-dependent dioxygenase YbiX